MIRTTKPTVLMVDDDKNILSAMRRTLGRKYTVLCAESGARGLELLEENSPIPVCFTDMQMPEMNGLEFLLAARQRWPDTVYVMLSGNADVKTQVDAIEKGAVFRYVSKPCAGEEITSLINECLEHYEQSKSSAA